MFAYFMQLIDKRGVREWESFNKSTAPLHSGIIEFYQNQRTPYIHHILQMVPLFHT